MCYDRRFETIYRSLAIVHFDMSGDVISNGRSYGRLKVTLIGPEPQWRIAIFAGRF